MGKNKFENTSDKNNAEKLGDGDISELSSEQQADLDETYKSAEKVINNMAFEKRGETDGAEGPRLEEVSPDEEEVQDKLKEAREKIDNDGLKGIK